MNKLALTIAGADPSGKAGIQADLSAFSALGVRGVSAITALTAQNSSRVKATSVVAAAFLSKQITTLLEESRPDAVKIGMTGSSYNLEAIGRLIKKHGLENVVFDPVLKSTSGFALLDKKGIRSIGKIFRQVKVLTPNIDEASIITGMKIKNIEDMEKAAKLIGAMGVENVLVKGGHAKEGATDILYDGNRFYHFKGKRIKGRKEDFHGTGCVLSAGIAAGLAKGLPVNEAISEAKKHLDGVLRERVGGK